MTGRSRARLVVGVAATILSLVACGSTVPLGEDGQAVGGEAGSLVQPGGDLNPAGPAGGPGSGPGAVGAPGTSATGGLGSSGTTAPGGAGGPDASGAPSAPVDPDSGLAGVDDSGVIEVGIPYTSNGDAANAALGASAITRGDEKAGSQATIDEINSRGGINGRELKAVYFAYDAQSTKTVSQQDQEACAHFTDDHNIAVLLGGGGDVMDACMKKNGVLVISSGSLISPDKTYLDQNPNYIQLGTLSQERMMSDLASTLKRLGYFSGWETLSGGPASTPAKVGVISLDTPMWSRPLRSTLLPRLAAVGYAVDASNVYEVRAPQTNGEVANTVADIKNASLRFQTDGVTHVIILDATALLTLLFVQNARQQNYYPRYGVNSASGLQPLKDTGAADNNDLQGALGLGWLPNIDLSAAAGEKYASDATRRCLEMIERRTGQTFTSTNAAALAVSKCDMADLMELALTRAGDDLSITNVVRIVEGLGSSFRSPFIPQTFFGPGRHDAVQLGFDIEWNTGCTCTKYLGQHIIP